MKVLFTICGRAGSKGIKGKNAGDFLGVPLVYYTLAAIELVRGRRPELLSIIALNTDSDELVRLMDESGVGYLRIDRPRELAGDRASKVSVIAYTMKEAMKVTGERFDFVVDLDITSPLRTVEDVLHVLDKRSTSDADTVFTVTGARRNPCFNMVRKNEAGYYERPMPSSFNSRQEAPTFYDMNASIYAYTPEFLYSGKQIFDGTCDIVEMEDTAVLDLDNPGDFELMEVIARHLFDARETFKVVHNAAVALTAQNDRRGCKAQGAHLDPAWVNRQISALFGDVDVAPYFDRARSKALHCFASINNKYFHRGVVNPLHTGQYALFLCFLAREALEHGDSETAEKVYYLNKTLHGFDIFYEVDIPQVFFMEHPVGTVLGRANYSNRLFVGQNVTVGGNKGKYPTIGENVALHAGCIVIGDTHIGNNVEISAGAFVKDETIPDNCLVFGSSPNLIVKQRSEEEMIERLYYFRSTDRAAI